MKCQKTEAPFPQSFPARDFATADQRHNWHHVYWKNQQLSHCWEATKSSRKACVLFLFMGGGVIYRVQLSTAESLIPLFQDRHYPCIHSLLRAQTATNCSPAGTQARPPLAWRGDGYLLIKVLWLLSLKVPVTIKVFVNHNGLVSFALFCFFNFLPSHLAARALFLMGNLSLY